MAECNDCVAGATGRQLCHVTAQHGQLEQRGATASGAWFDRRLCANSRRAPLRVLGISDPDGCKGGTRSRAEYDPCATATELAPLLVRFRQGAQARRQVHDRPALTTALLLTSAQSLLLSKRRAFRCDLWRQIDIEGSEKALFRLNAGQHAAISWRWLRDAQFVTAETHDNMEGGTHRTAEAGVRAAGLTVVDVRLHYYDNLAGSERHLLGCAPYSLSTTAPRPASVGPNTPRRWKGTGTERFRAARSLHKSERAELVHTRSIKNLYMYASRKLQVRRAVECRGAQCPLSRLIVKILMRLASILTWSPYIDPPVLRARALTVTQRAHVS